MSHISRRMGKEWAELARDGNRYEIRNKSEDDITQLSAIIPGPVGSPFEGGLFPVSIQLPNEYPFKPPRMNFDVKIFHPNIMVPSYSTELDVLHGAWSPAYTLSKCCGFLEDLLGEPPMLSNACGQIEAVEMAMRSLDEWRIEARRWMIQYAPLNFTLVWSREEHKYFPRPYRDAVRTILGLALRAPPPTPTASAVADPSLPTITSAPVSDVAVASDAGVAATTEQDEVMDPRTLRRSLLWTTLPPEMLELVVARLLPHYVRAAV